MVEIDGISVDETQLVGFLLPPLLFLVVFGVSWWILLRLSRERQSRGLFLMSLGFLIKTVVDGSWDLFYWSFGGPYLDDRYCNFKNTRRSSRIVETSCRRFWARVSVSAREVGTTHWTLE